MRVLLLLLLCRGKLTAPPFPSWPQAVQLSWGFKHSHPRRWQGEGAFSLIGHAWTPGRQPGSQINTDELASNFRNVHLLPCSVSELSSASAAASWLFCGMPTKTAFASGLSKIALELAKELGSPRNAWHLGADRRWWGQPMGIMPHLVSCPLKTTL